MAADLGLAGCVGEVVAADSAVAETFLEAFLDVGEGEGRES